MIADYLNHSYKLPDEMREELAKPYGKLYRGKGLDVLLKIKNDERGLHYIACVGDLVSMYSVKADLNPDILVIDGKTVRSEIIGVDTVLEVARGYTRIDAKNPPGCISRSLISALQRAVGIVENGGKVVVVVEGEEDLAVMPLGLLLPDSSAILYGQPGEGVVVLRIDEESKGIILKLLGRMHRDEC